MSVSRWASRASPSPRTMKRRFSWALTVAEFSNAQRTHAALQPAVSFLLRYFMRSRLSKFQNIKCHLLDINKQLLTLHDRFEAF